MRRTHRLSATTICWTSLVICCSDRPSLTLITPTSSSSSLTPHGKSQQPDDGKARNVKPVSPSPGAPSAQLPDLDDARQRGNNELKASGEIESTMRSRRKPLESRRGSKVGDPLPPKKTASTTSLGDGSERVLIASADGRGSVGTT